MAAPDVMEGYLSKKVGTIRWIERYYAWENNKLSYWKKEDDKRKNKESKGFFPGESIKKVWFPYPAHDKFNIEFKDKMLQLRGRTEGECERWVSVISKVCQTHEEKKEDEDDESTADWSIDQITNMMTEGQIMTAYFSNNTKKHFRLFCKDLTLYACPVTGGIDKAIIQLPLRRISDIYVGKQTPGFDTEVAASVPFDRCFTIISRKYTLDVEAKSYQMATHWLGGIKYLLTKSGKAVIVNEQETGGPDDAAAAQTAADPDEGHHDEEVHEDGHDEKSDHTSAEQQAEAAIAEVTKFSPEGVTGDGTDFDLELERSKTALIIVDVQNDFLPGGSLAVKDGNSVIDVINKLRKRVKFGLVALTQDFHPENHMSFYANNRDKPGAALFQVLDLPNGKSQMMWPTHCVQGSKGAEFSPELFLEDSDHIVKKGLKADVDSYSGFFDNDGKTKTELSEILKKANVEDVFVVGLAYDFCVGYTSLDAKKEGFNVYLIDDACKGVSEDTTKKMKQKLRDEGVFIIYADSIPDNGLMPDEFEVVAEEEEEEEIHMNRDEDSGPEHPDRNGTAAPKQLNQEDFMSEDFMGGISGAKPDDVHEDEEEPEPEPEPEPKPVVASPAPKPAAGAAATPVAAKPAAGAATPAAKPAAGAAAKPGTPAAKPAVTPARPGAPGAVRGAKAGAPAARGAKAVAPGVRIHGGAKPVRGAKGPVRGAKATVGVRGGKATVTARGGKATTAVRGAKTATAVRGAKAPVRGAKTTTPARPGAAPVRPGTTAAKPATAAAKPATTTPAKPGVAAAKPAGATAAKPATTPAKPATAK